MGVHLVVQLQLYTVVVCDKLRNPLSIMSGKSAVSPFATFLIIGPTCFFLGILFALFPYDYNVLWTSPVADNSTVDLRGYYFDMQENHIKFLRASPPLIS